MDRKRLLAAAAVISFAASAQADESATYYLGASIGWATDQVDTFEDSGVGFKIFGGHSFNEYFAAEFGYVDAGKLEERLDGVEVTVESSGIVAAVLGRLPIGDAFSLFAKVGYVLYDETVSVSDGGVRESVKNTADDPLYGIGAELDVGERLKLRAECELVDIPNADFDIVTVGATLRF